MTVTPTVKPTVTSHSHHGGDADPGGDQHRGCDRHTDPGPDRGGSDALVTCAA